MSEVGFTKGPWSWFMTGDDRAIYIGKDLFGKSNATVASIDNDDYLGDKQQQFLANAHLIAAAPDLYETMKKVRDSLEEAFGDMPSWMETEFEMMDNVLAKARGETV